MSVVSSWLLSIAGVVLLSVMTEFVLPDGQINKFIRVVFSFITLLVIILPIPKLFKRDFNLSNYLNEQTSLQRDYLEQVNLDKLNTLTEELNLKVAKRGIKNIEISVGANIFAKTLEIYTITADLRNIAYDSNIESKTIENAKAIILDVVGDYDILDGVEVKWRE